MWFFHSSKTRSAVRSKTRSRSFRPRLEGLEDRCLLSPGQLDPTFGSGGIVTTSFPNGSAGNVATVLQPDGKILSAGTAGNGTQFALARYTPNGSLNASFGNGGLVTTSFSNSTISFSSNAMALYPNAGTANDGKIVVSGLYETASYSVWSAVVRYNPNGSLDTTFANGGIFTNSLVSGSSHAYAVAIQSDGKMVIVGNSQTSGTPVHITVTRLNVDGTFDTTFGSGGIVISALGTNDSEAHAVALQADGKIDVAGYLILGSGLTRVQSVVARYNTDGSLDPTFGNGNGYAAFSTNGSSELYGANGLLIQPDGKIVTAGTQLHPPVGPAVFGNWPVSTPTGVSTPPSLVREWKRRQSWARRTE